MTDTTIPLTETQRIPAVGLGTYLIPDDATGDAVSAALEIGYRHVDTAEGYSNEAGVGRGLKAFFDAGHARDEVFVTTKLWPGNPAWGQTPRDTAGTLAALDESLAKLGLDYVDLYLIHAPFAPEQRLAQWRGLVEARSQGKARAIGVSNFSAAHIDALLDAGLPAPDANQIELHPWSQKPELVAYLTERGIRPIAYSSLVPHSAWRVDPGQGSAKTEEMRAEDSPFRAMAEKYGVSEAQVLLRWGVQKGYPVLPKSTKRARLAENLDLFGFEIDEADMRAIEGMDRGRSFAWEAGDPMSFG